ncbi:MAG: methionine biosynthesis protein MetW [Planctomycetia bacterium]|nr:methionine biosynthesis protein MetW [Planctomycetia bacterium]
MAKRYCMPDPTAALTDEILLQHVERGSRVVDFGCGDGRLLAKLRDVHDCDVQGIDLDPEHVLAAIERGVPVVRANLDAGLSEFPNQSFDIAVLSQTLQQVLRPQFVLEEMLRVAKRGLVVVPNFGYWQVRFQVLWQGRAPITESLPYEWYNSPNIHFMTLRDFRSLCEKQGISIIREIPIIKRRAIPEAWGANLRAESALYVLERLAG